MDKYHVKVSDDIFEQIETIRDYIKTVLLSSQSADKVAREILQDLRSLEVFSERGFDADAKVQSQISRFVKTKGILISHNRYIVLYTIDVEQKVVKVTHLFPDKSDYANYFL